jgi:hypothetical protein
MSAVDLGLAAAWRLDVWTLDELIDRTYPASDLV